MKKDELRDAIRGVEPDNTVAANARTSHAALTNELKAAKRRKANRDKDQAIPVTALYRLEDKERLSWKLVLQGNGDNGDGELFHGLELPMKGSILPSPDETNPFMVIEHSKGLEIHAGDLAVREEFDPRRIYVTPNGSNAVFKRLHSNGKPILWSYKMQGEIMIGRGVRLERTERMAKPTASASRRMTQKILAAFLIADNPEMTGGTLTDLLREAFPSARIGSRHGPHYLSLSRNGRLPEVPDSDPRHW